MKKAFAIATLIVWTTGLLVGLIFAAVGQVNATNEFPGTFVSQQQEIQALTVQNEILESIIREGDLKIGNLQRTLDQQQTLNRELPLRLGDHSRRWHVK